MLVPPSPADLDQRCADLNSAIVVREYTLRTLPLPPRLRRAMADHLTSLRVQLRLLEMRRDTCDLLY